MLAGIDGAIDWTLHDVHLYFGAQVQLSAILRTSAPVAEPPDGFVLREVDAGQRLMFPVNDCLAALPSLAAKLPDGLAQGLLQPLHLHALPDGLRIACLAPPGDDDDLPDRLGSLALAWRRAPLVVAPPDRVEGVAVGAGEALGAVAAGVTRSGAAVWQLPALAAGDELTGVGRALAARLQSSATD